MPRFTGWLRPVVDAAARVNSGVHRKLLFGFLAGALLLVALGALGLVVIRQMNDRMVELNRAQLKATRGHEMLYAVTAQSHYRAMALLLPDDAARYNTQVEEAKATFVDLLEAMACANRPTRRSTPTSRASTRSTRRRVSGCWSGSSRATSRAPRPCTSTRST